MAPQEGCRGILLCLLLMSIETYSAKEVHESCAPCICNKTTTNCTGQKLSHVPPVIPISITNLILHQNVITKLIDNQFDHLNNLVTLDLSINNISVIKENAFIGLKNLTHLYLDGNPLLYNNATFSEFLFEPLQKLVSLRINNSTFNKYSYYPDTSLQHLNALESLYIDGLYDKSFGPGFAKLKKLWILVLDGSRGYCNLGEISNSTLSKLKSLEKVYINYCSLYYIEPGSFSHMENLTTLDLSNNACLGIDGVTNATHGLSRTRITNLFANRVETNFPLFVSVPDQLAINLHNTSLTTIQLDENQIVAFGNEALGAFPKTLTHVSIRDNRFRIAPYIIQISSLSGLWELDLSGKYTKTVHTIPTIKNFPIILCQRRVKRECVHYVEETSDSQHAWISLSKMLSPSLNESEHLTFWLPPKMKTLNYSKAQIYLHITEVFLGNNSITTIDLSDNIITNWQGPVHGLQHLTHLDLSTNRAGYLDQAFFDHFKNLIFLNISYNYIGKCIGNDTSGKLFKNLQSLQTLDLTENMIRKVHFKTFSSLRSLKKLFIGHNKISVFPVLLEDCVKLTFIDLKYNQFRWLSPRMTDKLESYNVQLNLAENSLDCTCTNLHFLSWMTTTKLLQPAILSKYKCVNANSHVKYFTDKSDLAETYLYLNTYCNIYSLVIGATCAVMMSLTLLIVGLLYRYRWKLRYWYYAAKHKYNQSTTYQSTSDFYYDAFVSFADGDRGFVVNELVNKLEQEGGLSLNIHQRDFTAGRPIAENIIEAIQKSRRTLCVLSRDFLESYWCKYELQMANMESVTTGRDVLLIVMMEHIPTEKIPAEILYHIQSDSYIQYPAEGETDMFWRNLIHSLKT